MKRLLILLMTSLILMAFIPGGCRSPRETGTPGLTEEDYRKIAQEFVMTDSTFLFDGIKESLKLVETLRPDNKNSFTFVFKFESRHAGYGDRTGQVLLQVITPHEAAITIEQGKINSALMDGRWDMLNQKMVGE